MEHELIARFSFRKDVNRISLSAPLMVLVLASLVGGCATLKKETPVTFTTTPGVEGTSEEIESRFFAKRGKLHGRSQPALEVSDDVVTERSARIALLGKSEADVLRNFSATLANMNLRAAKFSEQRLFWFGGGSLLSISATVLTVANPAANAATIAGLSAASTGVFSIQNQRIEEGMSKSAVVRQRAALVSSFNSAHTEYLLLLTKLTDNLGVAESVWSGWYGRASSLLSKLLVAATSEEILVFAQADLAQPQASSGDYIEANNEMLARARATALLLAMRDTLRDSAKADKELKTALADEVEIDEALKKTPDDAALKEKKEAAAKVTTDKAAKATAAKAAFDAAQKAWAEDAKT